MHIASGGKFPYKLNQPDSDLSLHDYTDNERFVLVELPVSQKKY